MTAVTLVLSIGLVLAVGVVSGSSTAPGVAAAQATVQSTDGPTRGDDGLSALQSSTSAGPLATVANQAPNASVAYSPASPGVGDDVTFDASASSDSDGAIVQYRWDFGDDGSIDRQTSGPTTTRQYSESGTHAVRVVVVDDAGATDAASTTVTVAANQPPTASFDYAPSEPEVGQSVTFDAGGSSDPDGTVVEFRWDFDGDGSVDRQTSGPTVDHQFSTAGTRSVRLVVVDDEGATGADDVSVTVPANEPPTALLGYAPANPDVDESVTFDGSSSTDSDGTVVEYRWDFDGDGAIDRTTTDATVSHRYTASGNYPVELVVVDDDSAADSATTTLSVAPNQPPVATFEYDPPDVRVDEPATFDASGSSDPDGTVVEYRWDFDGDGTFDDVTASAETDHTFDRSGTHTVALEVVDDDGATVRATDANVVVSAGGRTPVARCALSRQTVAAGESLTIDASNSENADLVRVDVDGDGTYEWTDRSDLAVTVSYDEPGTYTPRVAVVGEGEATDTVECSELSVDGPAGTERTSAVTATEPSTSASRTTTSAGASPTTSDPSTTTTPGQPGFGAAIAVLVLVVVAWTTMRKP